MPRFAASRLTGVVNGVFIGGTRGVPDPRARLTPQALFWSINPAFLRRGNNVIHLRIEADASHHEGLTRIYFGGAPEAQSARLAREQMQGLAHRVFGFASIVLGFAALVVWFRQRGDVIIGWLGLSAIGAGLGPALYDVMGLEPTPALREALVMIYAYAFVPPLLMVMPQLGQLRAPGLTIVSWGVLGLAVIALVALGAAGAPSIAPYVGLFYACAILVAIAAFWSTRRRVVGSRYLPLVTFAAAGLCAAFLFHDLAIWFGYLDFDRMVSGPLIPAALTLLTTVTLLSRHLETYRALQRSHADLERRVDERTRQLEVASRHKSQFLASMSHELRTPLNAILGYTELILDGIYGEMPAKIRDVMTRIDKSGRHLLGLINDILDLSKIEAGQLVLSLNDYSMEEVVQTVFTAMESLAAEKQLALKPNVVADLPRGRGDERRLSQVLLNLVGNALKFTETGEVRVEATARDGQFVVLVSDTGLGIAPADQQKIFEEFQQVDSSLTRKKGGTGLGLSIARRIVELHGGRLWVESVPGKGSTFSFTVPVRVEQQVTP